jgi:hypothetical protein
MKRAGVGTPSYSKQTARPYLSRAMYVHSFLLEKKNRTPGKQNRTGRALRTRSTRLLAVDTVRACATPDDRGGERAGKHASARAPVCQPSPGPADPAQFPGQSSLIKWE